MTTIPRRHRFGDRHHSWLIPYDDATEPVELDRTLADILRATPGSSTQCMNSICIRAQRNAHVFPHPVFMVQTDETRVWIVDQLDAAGEPAHCVRYELSRRDSDLIKAHDAYGAGEPGVLKLRVPSDPKGSPKRAANKQEGRFSSVGGRYSGDGKPSRERPAVQVLGSARRYQVAVGALNLEDSP